MIPFRRLMVLCVLLALMATGVHMTLEHGGYTVVGQHAGHVDDFCAHPHDHDGNHYHDFNASTSSLGYESKGLLSPQWTPLFNLVLAQWAASLRATQTELASPPLLEAPDERARGWLFVCRTALPVRGPSFLA